MAPKKADADLQQEVANELQVENYKMYRATSENLTKGEEAEASTLKDQVYSDAVSAGEDKTVATEKSLQAYKRFAFKAKLLKAVAKYERKAAAGKQPEAAEAQAAQDPAAGEAAGAAEPDPAGFENKKKAAYQEHIMAAYNRVMGHRVFKDVAAQPPNPIQEGEAGDCGVQDEKLNTKCWVRGLSLSTRSMGFKMATETLSVFGARRLLTTRSAPWLSLVRSSTAQGATSSGSTCFAH
jgi:hypothetical protein